MTSKGTSDWADELDAAVRAVRAAATVCRAVRAEPGFLAGASAATKQDRSPVTVADYAAQAVVCRLLSERFPADPVVGEEGSGELAGDDKAPLREAIVRHVRAALRKVPRDAGRDPETSRSQIPREPDETCVLEWIDLGAAEPARRFWTVDPIDGTKGFLRGGQYAVALALIVDGVTVVAAMASPHLPVTGGFFGEASSAAGESDADPGRGVIHTAVRGQGAWARPLFPAAADHRPIRVSTRSQAADLRRVESVESSHSRQDQAELLSRRLGITAPVEKLDSQAKYGLVADGRADVWLRVPTTAGRRECIWDHAAGALIVESAGGTVTDLDGRALDFGRGKLLEANRGVVASNGPLHAAILAAHAGE